MARPQFSRPALRALQPLLLVSLVLNVLIVNADSAQKVSQVQRAAGKSAGGIFSRRSLSNWACPRAENTCCTK